jgi:hypothetical protein
MSFARQTWELAHELSDGDGGLRFGVENGREAAVAGRARQLDADGWSIAARADPSPSAAT